MTGHTGNLRYAQRGILIVDMHPRVNRSRQQ